MIFLCRNPFNTYKPAKSARMNMEISTIFKADNTQSEILLLLGLKMITFQTISEDLNFELNRGSADVTSR